MNLKTIADGLAARFVAVVATNGTATETATATADLPNNISRLALLVYPPTGDLTINLGPHIDDHYTFPIRLLRDPTDVPSRSQWLYAWATALRLRVEADMDLGVAGVSSARVDGMRVELDGQQYSSVDGSFVPFDVVELIAVVHVLEIAPTVSI